MRMSILNQFLIGSYGCTHSLNLKYLEGVSCVSFGSQHNHADFCAFNVNNRATFYLDACMLQSIQSASQLVATEPVTVFWRLYDDSHGSPPGSDCRARCVPYRT